MITKDQLYNEYITLDKTKRQVRLDLGVTRRNLDFLFKKYDIKKDRKEWAKKGLFKVGHKLSQESIERMREKNIGRKCSDETKQKMSVSHIGKKFTPEQRLHYRESKLGEKNPSYRKEYTDDERLKWSKYSKEAWKKMDDNTKKQRSLKLRNVRLEYVKKMGGSRIGKQEKSILDYFQNNCLHYNIIRQYEIAGYFVDGYCPALNLVIEVDEKHHNKLKQRNKDILREQLIKEELSCNFLRLEV